MHLQSLAKQFAAGVFTVALTLQLFAQSGLTPRNMIVSVADGLRNDR